MISLFCKHEWKIISQSEIYDCVVVHLVEGHYQDIKVILVSCNKCGKLKKIKMK